jgi:hypothetical protein
MHSEVEERDTRRGTLYKRNTMHTKEKEKDHPAQFSRRRSNTSHFGDKLCVEPTTLCASLRSKTLSRTLVVSEGRKDNSKGCYHL